MFLWELKNAIISQNLRELCVIETPKPSRKIPPNVPERSRRQGRGKEFFSINAWASRRHIISIALKSVCFLEHLWYFFGNSKTLLFHYTVPEPVEGTFSLLISVPEPIEGTFLFLPVISTPLNHRIIYYYTRCLSVVEGTFSILISVPEPTEGTLFLLH